MILTLIAAMAENRVIGRDGGLPWRLPDDMRHFMRTTSGHPVIMGRRTWESMDGPLRNRRNIVLTRREDFSAEGAEVVHTLEEAIRRVVAGDEGPAASGEEGGAAAGVDGGAAAGGQGGAAAGGGGTAAGGEGHAAAGEGHRAAGEDDPVFIIGGGEIYELALPVADRLDLTIVHAEVEGDARFPAWDPAAWRLAREEHHPADERHEHAFTFRTYVRDEG